VASLQDASALHLLFEFCPGGELLRLLQQSDRGVLDGAAAAFYAAGLALALEYLHDRSIAHRDLKPDNVLIDARGYPKLAGFEFAKEVTGATYTLCGTPEYLAPELILNEGHGHAADWWALGVLLHEMLTGDTPYVERFAPLKLYESILRGGRTAPRGVWLAPAATHLMDALLRRAPADRMASVRSGAELVLRRHAFFEQIEWRGLLGQELSPPHVPELSGALDASNFDAGFEPLPLEPLGDLAVPIGAFIDF